MKPEEFEQIYLIDWAHTDNNIHPYLIHLRNEGKRSRWEANRAVRMGLKKGACDLFFARPTKQYPGMWLELKSKDGKVSIYQKNFIELMRGVGYHADVYWGWPSAANAIYEYLGINKKV